MSTTAVSPRRMWLLSKSAQLAWLVTAHVATLAQGLRDIWQSRRVLLWERPKPKGKD